MVSALWDLKEKNIVHLFDGKYLHTYVFVQYSVKGPILVKIGPVEISNEGDVRTTPEKIEIPQGSIPIMSIGGVLTCQSSSGNLSPFVHTYFCYLPDTISSAPPSRERDNDNPSDRKYLLSKFTQSLALLKLEIAWQAALELDGRHYWLALSHEAMDMLNIELALRVYRQLGDAGMVMSLEDCQHIEDRCVCVCVSACVCVYLWREIDNVCNCMSVCLCL